jgi:hypothetical protein
MNSEEGYGLDYRFSIGNAKQRQPDDRQKTENQYGNCQVKRRRGRNGRRTPQNQRDAKQRKE